MYWFRNGCVLVCAGALFAAAPLEIRTHELPWAAFGLDYRVTIQTQIDGRCTFGNPELSLSAGSLPRGLDLEGDWLTGVPEEVGTFRFRVRGANDCVSTEQEYVLLVTGRPILRASPENVVFEYRIGDLAPEPQSVLISSTWPDLPYTITANAPWLTAHPEEGVTPSAGEALSADRVAVTVNTKDLAPGTYQARLLVTSRQGANAPSIPVELRVIAGQ